MCGAAAGTNDACVLGLAVTGRRPTPAYETTQHGNFLQRTEKHTAAPDTAGHCFQLHKTLENPDPACRSNFGAVQNASSSLQHSSGITAAAMQMPRPIVSIDDSTGRAALSPLDTPLFAKSRSHAAPECTADRPPCQGDGLGSLEGQPCSSQPTPPGQKVTCSSYLDAGVKVKVHDSAPRNRSEAAKLYFADDGVLAHLLAKDLRPSEGVRSGQGEACPANVHSIRPQPQQEAVIGPFDVGPVCSAGQTAVGEPRSALQLEVRHVPPLFVF